MTNCHRMRRRANLKAGRVYCTIPTNTIQNVIQNCCKAEKWSETAANRYIRDNPNRRLNVGKSRVKIQKNTDITEQLGSE